MDTRAYMTKTIMVKRKNPVFDEDKWVVGLDMGYSSIKNFGPNAYNQVPFYVKKLPKDNISLGRPNNTDILYRDTNTGDVYAVGERALSMISIESTNDSNETMYGRNRYFSEMFYISSRVGLGLCLRKNDFGDPTGKHIVCQTGLPPKYSKSDAPLLREALAQDYDFDLKIGNGDWEHFEFSLTPSDIMITYQPMGSMISIAIDKNGRSTSDANKLFHSNILVFDPGFKTGDTCLIKKGNINPALCQTIDRLSMISVLQRTSDEIRDRYGVEIPVPAMQSYLEDGRIVKYDSRTFASEKYDFGPILEAKSREVCNEAFSQLGQLYNFSTINSLVLTGGTGAAWDEMFKKRFEANHNLSIIPGNRNDDIPRSLANVRGYYMYAINDGKILI